MNPVVHFELPAQDSKRAKEFYTKAFGWQVNQLGEEMSNYVVVMTTESTKEGPIKPGAINGGIYTVTNEMPAQHPSVVMSVVDINEAMKKIVASGGKVMGQPMDIPGVGKYLSFIDTEGNRLSILQPKI